MTGGLFGYFLKKADEKYSSSVFLILETTWFLYDNHNLVFGKEKQAFT